MCREGKYEFFKGVFKKMIDNFKIIIWGSDESSSVNFDVNIV